MNVNLLLDKIESLIKSNIPIVEGIAINFNGDGTVTVKLDSGKIVKALNRGVITLNKVLTFYDKSRNIYAAVSIGNEIKEEGRWKGRNSKPKISKPSLPFKVLTEWKNNEADTTLIYKGGDVDSNSVFEGNVDVSTFISSFSNSGEEEDDWAAVVFSDFDNGKLLFFKDGEFNEITINDIYNKRIGYLNGGHFFLAYYPYLQGSPTVTGGYGIFAIFTNSLSAKNYLLTTVPNYVAFDISNPWYFSSLLNDPLNSTTTLSTSLGSVNNSVVFTSYYTETPQTAGRTHRIIIDDSQNIPYNLYYYPDNIISTSYLREVNSDSLRDEAFIGDFQEITYSDDIKRIANINYDESITITSSLTESISHHIIDDFYIQNSIEILNQYTFTHNDELSYSFFDNTNPTTVNGNGEKHTVESRTDDLPSFTYLYKSDKVCMGIQLLGKSVYNSDDALIANVQYTGTDGLPPGVRSGQTFNVELEFNPVHTKSFSMSYEEITPSRSRLIVNTTIIDDYVSGAFDFKKRLFFRSYVSPTIPSQIPGTLIIEDTNLFFNRGLPNGAVTPIGNYTQKGKSVTVEGSGQVVPNQAYAQTTTRVNYTLPEMDLIGRNVYLYVIENKITKRYKGQISDVTFVEETGGNSYGFVNKIYKPSSISINVTEVISLSFYCWENAIENGVIITDIDDDTLSIVNYFYTYYAESVNFYIINEVITCAISKQIPEEDIGKDIDSHYADIYEFKNSRFLRKGTVESEVIGTTTDLDYRYNMVSYYSID